MDVTIINPLTHSAEWEGLASAHPDYCFFHSSAWAGVLSQTYQHKPLYLHLSRNGETQALVPLMQAESMLAGKRGVCLPFTDYCEPLYFSPDVTTLPLESFIQLGAERNWRHFEVRSSTAFEAPATPSIEFYTHRIGLRREVNDIRSTLTESVRRGIQKAERGGLTVELTTDKTAVSVYYQLHELTRKRHGLPPQPRRFFANIHDHVIARGLGFVAIARLDSKAVAAAVFFHAGGSAIYKFGASDERYQSLRANNLVMWEAIQFLQKKGIGHLHMGRTSMENEGLRRYKLGWGAEEQTCHYYKYDMRVRDWAQSPDRVRGFYNKVFGNLPRALNRLAGALIYPHLD